MSDSKHAAPHKPIRRRWIWALLLLVCFGSLQANSVIAPRLRVGINLFPAFLAARMQSEQRPDHAVVVFVEMNREIEQIVDLLEDRLRRSMPDTTLSLAKAGTLAAVHRNRPITALFIAQHLSEVEIAELTRFADSMQIISFSPFAGDVERGILGGIAVSDRILPEINLGTLRRSGISLKPFFLRVARHYGSGAAE